MAHPDDATTSAAAAQGVAPDAAATPATASTATSPPEVTAATPSSSGDASFGFSRYAVASNGFGGASFGSVPPSASAFGDSTPPFGSAPTATADAFGNGASSAPAGFGGFGGFGSTSSTSSTDSSTSGGLFGSTPAFGCAPSSGFSFGSTNASSHPSPFSFSASQQPPAAAAPATVTPPSANASLFASYPPPTTSHPHPSTFQVPPNSTTFATSAAPVWKQPEPVVKKVAAKKKPVSSLVVDEDEGSVKFSSHDSAEFRYRLTLTKSDKIKVWIQDRASKHQWESKELKLSEIVSVDSVIPMMELKDYFESFKRCLSESSTGLFKSPSKYDLVPLQEKEKSKGDVELQLTLGIVIFSKVLSPVYSFRLHALKLSEMDVLNAKIHDQDEEIEQLRAQVDALASAVASAPTNAAPASPGLFGVARTYPQYVRGELTSTVAMSFGTSERPLIWSRCDGGGGMFGGICHMRDSGAITLSQDGVFSIQVVVHHTNSYGVENRSNQSLFGGPWVERPAFVLQKNGVAIASSFGSNTTSSVQSSPLYHIVSAKRDEEYRVVYLGNGVAREGSYIIIHQIK